MLKAGMEHRDVTSTLDFDYVIIGAGTAGCLLANRLSQNPDNKVLVIEAGSKDKYLRTKIPVGYLFSMGNSKTDWCYTPKKKKV